MLINVMKSKLHRVTVTGADLNYEGSISICPSLISAAEMNIFEKVDIYNVNNGARFSTYIIEGKPGEIALNGAAARLALAGDKLIIVTFAYITKDELKNHKPVVILVDEKNGVSEKIVSAKQ
ncbi:MAG: aspartate 1-decarboxylase [Candidatus Riflebacteria bacterium]|nr:aspartate 1-decarboxylase [Candidatus Riflebacteria bacterium]